MTTTSPGDARTLRTPLPVGTEVVVDDTTTGYVTHDDAQGPVGTVRVVTRHDLLVGTLVVGDWHPDSVVPATGPHGLPDLAPAATAAGRRTATYDGTVYAPGTLMVVTRAGAHLTGFVPEPGCQRGWRGDLLPGDLVVCLGNGRGMGSDPGYGVEFESLASREAGASHCDVSPRAGGVWDYRPQPGLLVPFAAVLANPRA